MTRANSSNIPMVMARRTTKATVMPGGEAMTNGNDNDTAISFTSYKKTWVKIMELPENLISEIFSWLPAKSIFKFKSCSKFILEFTNETNFALKQTQNLTLQDDSSFFIQGIYGWDNFNYKTQIYALPGHEASSGIPTNFLKFLNDRSVNIRTHSNGLLLCQFLRRSSPSVELFICNPATQSYSSIATPSCLQENSYATVVFALGCGHSSVPEEEYQLVVLENNPDHESSEYLVCKAYNPKEGMWKEREKSLFMGQKRMICCPRGRDHYISYDFETGETKRIVFPEEVEIGSKLFHSEGYEIGIFKWGKVRSPNDSICLVVLVKLSVFTLWVMTDYESNSWSKILTISLDEMGLDKEDSIVSGYTIINGDSLVFAAETNVYRYDLIGGRERRLERIGEHRFDWVWKFVSYSNTLCSCGADCKDLSILT